MKKRFLLLPLAAGFAYFTLSSNSGGYPTNKTGSDSSSVTGCGGSGCHGSATTSGLMMTILLDSAGSGTFVTKYTPGKQYVVRLAGTTPIGSSLPKFGFQLSVIKGTAGSSAVNAGTWGTLPTNVSLSSTSPAYLTHDAPLSGTSITGGVYIDSVNIPWTAPAAGTGTVRMYGVLNAVNDNSNADATDKYNTKTAQFAEMTTSGVAEVGSNSEAFVGPNPVSNMLTVSLPGNTAAHIVVTGLDGRVAHVCMATGTANINTADWVAGIYYVRVIANGTSKVYPVVKQ